MLMHPAMRMDPPVSLSTMTQKNYVKIFMEFVIGAIKDIERIVDTIN